MSTSTETREGGDKGGRGLESRERGGKVSTMGYSSTSSDPHCSQKCRKGWKEEKKQIRVSLIWKGPVRQELRPHLVI